MSRLDTWSRAVAAVLLVSLGAACGRGADDDAVDASAVGPKTTTSAVEDGSGVGPDDPGAFCEAVDALDRTDGTTDSTIVLDAIEQMRRTAPADIRDDVNRGLDSLVVGNYPEAADPSMEAMSLEERQAGAARMRAFVEEHC